MSRHARPAVVAAVLLMCAAAADAGSILSQSPGAPATETIEFNARGDLRLGGGGMPDTMGIIARDGRFYFFGEVNGKPAVVDMQAAQKKALAKGMKKEEQPPPAETVKDLRNTGRRQSVAGLEGEVFIVTWASAEGSREEEVVLTRDPRLAPVLKTLRELPELGEKKASAWFREAVVARGYFPLKSEQELVTSLDFAEVPAERFALKAKPSDDIELLFQMIFGAAFGQLGQALGETTKALGEGLGAALGGASGEGASASADAAAGPAPLSKQSLEAQKRIEAQLARLAKPKGLQLPRAQTDYAGWDLHDGGPLLLHLPPTDGYSLSSGGGSLQVSFSPEASGTSVRLDLAYVGDAIKPGDALEAARDSYRRVAQRLGKGEILGYQPMALDGIAGALEIYDEADADSGEARRVVKWLGFQQVETEVYPIECQVVLEAAAYERLAPVIGGILQSFRVATAAE